MDRPARIDRAPTTNHRQPWTSLRLRRRLRFRASDLVARYGGEEFVAILDGTGRDEAVRIAEETRTAFAEQSFRGASGERLSATVSTGCAELGPEDGLGELLGACDVGLAMAKGAGRNQVVAA